ncbi:DNA-binding protein [Bacteroidia bacterium]|nr:DNA-binding protein [Bacteroidia bacterium]GHV45110.1 DNA-binding protein [Bacteroidia bacterium]
MQTNIATQAQIIERKIYEIRGQRVMFDFDLAEIYEVETRALKQAVKRNIDRFPPDFMFQLTKNEWVELITFCDNLPENIKHSPTTPSAFTEQGVSMLSTVLRSKKAIQMNIAIMRAFVFIRQYALEHKDLTEKLSLLEEKYDQKFNDITHAINYLLQKDQVQIEQQKKRRPIGFGVKYDDV